MFLRKQKALSIAVAVGVRRPRCFAQITEPPAFPDLRIEVTGSRIARTDAETALPVQVISRDEILRGNFQYRIGADGAHLRERQRMNSQLSLGTKREPGTRERKPARARRRATRWCC
jgi:iron complex outermembrane receptor protein